MTRPRSPARAEPSRARADREAREHLAFARNATTQILGQALDAVFQVIRASRQSRVLSDEAGDQYGPYGIFDHETAAVDKAARALLTRRLRNQPGRARAVESPFEPSLIRRLGELHGQVSDVRTTDTELAS
jgi:hypothetical protein